MKNYLNFELEIKNLAIELNKSMINTVFNNGIIGRKCFSTGRTIVYTYDIPADWEFSDDLKQEVSILSGGQRKRLSLA